MDKKKVYILLQEYQCFFGKICKRIKGGRYNHASIGIKDPMSEFYSFRSKWGLCIEHPFRFTKEHKKNIQCVIYEIEVTDEEYARIEDQIEQFWDRKENYRYSYLSVVLGFVGIKHRFKKGYYCSRFVAEILEASGIANFKKDPSLCMPYDFTGECRNTLFEGVARDFCFKPVSIST